MTKNKYHVIAVPKIAYNSIQQLQMEILKHGANSFQAPWIRDLFSFGRLPPGKGNIIGAGTIYLALIISGKTKEEINQMSKEEVIVFLRENGYSLPPEWGH